MRRWVGVYVFSMSDGFKQLDTERAFGGREAELAGVCCKLFEDHKPMKGIVGKLGPPV